MRFPRLGVDVSMAAVTTLNEELEQLQVEVCSITRKPASMRSHYPLITLVESSAAQRQENLNMSDAPGKGFVPLALASSSACTHSMVGNLSLVFF
jgi:hypothetical protein